MYKLIVAAAFCAVLTGCGESDPPAEPQQPAKQVDSPKLDDVVEDVKKKGEEITAEARQQFEDYLESLGGLTGELEGVRGFGDVAKAPAVKNVVDQVKQAVESLGGLDPAVLDQLKSQFSGQLESAIAALRAQIDRISENPQLKPVADVLKNLDLIE